MENLLLLVAGGVLTALGAWANDVRGERRRKREKLEEAYLTWLNTHSSLIDRLKELARSAETEPETLEAHELLLEKLARLHSDFKDLTAALNLAFIYERDSSKKALLEVQAQIHGQLKEMLGTILAHYKVHLDFQTAIEITGDQLSRVEEIAKSEAVKQRPELGEAVDNLQQDILNGRERAHDHLAKCSASLSTSVKRILQHVQNIEESSPALRKLLVK
ncbi:MAG TPA: hypothetical protein VM911_13890 [Pyrinomonadaceae bacterium]|jgi:hypothetical protein|nr:hypothetical protein [Pyrinomonadaceae bacterium]